MAGLVFQRQARGAAQPSGAQERRGEVGVDGWVWHLALSRRNGFKIKFSFLVLSTL